MHEPLSILGATASSISLVMELIKAIDLIVGACTNNTPTAALWSESLSKLKMELVHVQDQLGLVQGEIEPLRVKRGPGADAANLKRKEVAFDELLLEMSNELRTNETQFCNATNNFNENGLFDWARLELQGTRAREAVAPIQLHTRELKKIRLRVHSARNVIIDAFIAHCYNYAGDRFPTLEGLGGIRDRLALNFLSPKPFCYELSDAKSSLTPGLLVCNRSDDSLKKLRDRIQHVGVHWVNGAGPANPASIFDVLEKCQRTLLGQLDKGIFDAIINKKSLLTSTDRMRAIRGRSAVQEWRSTLPGGGRILMASGGRMSHGKPSIMNSMPGRSLLPTASRSFTQWQCRS